MHCLPLLENRLPIVSIAKYPTMQEATPQQGVAWRHSSLICTMSNLDNPESVGLRQRQQ